MKRLFLGLWLTTLGACAVGTPIATKDAVKDADGSQPTQAEALQANLGTWCLDACSRFVSCPDFPNRMTCPGDCTSQLHRFLDKGGDCVSLLSDYEACLDTITTCEEAMSGTPCNDEAYAQCMDDGSVPGTTDKPMQVGVGAGVECDVSEGGTANPGHSDAPVSCDLSADNCSDGSMYRLICDTIGDVLTCNCFKDGQVTGTFTPHTGCPPAATEADVACGGWLLNY